MLGHVAQSVGNALPDSGSGASRKLGSLKFYSLDGPPSTASSAATIHTFTAPTDGVVALLATGAGAGGRFNNSTITWGGGGGGGASGRSGGIPIKAGQTITLSMGRAGVANGDGGDVVITLPDGAICLAGGGKVPVSTQGGEGGTATGFDYSENGGAGGIGTSSAAGAGGASGGFGGAEYQLPLYSPALASSANGNAPGGGGAGSKQSNPNRVGGISTARLIFSGYET